MERGDVLGEHVKSRWIVQIVVGLVVFWVAKEMVYWGLQAGGRRYPVLSCKGVEIVHHEEWSSSSTDCSISREKDGDSIRIVINSVGEATQGQFEGILANDGTWQTPARYGDKLVTFSLGRTRSRFLVFNKQRLISGEIIAQDFTPPGNADRSAVILWHVSHITAL
jgi:hypothetical protein